MRRSSELAIPMRNAPDSRRPSPRARSALTRFHQRNRGRLSGRLAAKVVLTIEPSMHETQKVSQGIRARPDRGWILRWPLGVSGPRLAVVGMVETASRCSPMSRFEHSSDDGTRLPLRPLVDGSIVVPVGVPERAGRRLRVVPVKVPTHHQLIGTLFPRGCGHPREYVWPFRLRDWPYQGPLALSDAQAEICLLEIRFKQPLCSSSRHSDQPCGFTS